MKSNINELASIGFTKIGKWQIEKDNNQELLEPKFYEDCISLTKIDNALYAFVEVERKENEVIEVKYIGKTSKSIENRFKGYKYPGKTTATNKKCNSKIQESLNNEKGIEIWAFTPTIPFQILGYNVNLAAGLEDDLISKLNPLWNGGKTDFASAEMDLEKIDEARINLDELPLTKEASNCEPLKDFNNQPCNFKIKLGTAYFNTGFINPGSDASKELGQHGKQITIYLGSKVLCVNSTINRTANPNGSVRIIGNNSKIAEWFQTHFSQGQDVNAFVIDAKTIFLEDPKLPFSSLFSEKILMPELK